MQIKINQLTMTDAGTFESIDVGCDMLSESLVERDGRYVVEIGRDDLEAWLEDQGYCRAPEFQGWGEVYAMQPTDDDGRDCGPEEYLAIEVL